MKAISSYWWIALIITVILFFVNKSAWEEAEAYADYYTGWEGYAEGYISGFIGDYGKAGRVEDRYYSLLDKAEFWRKLFILSLLVTIGLGGTALSKFWKKHN